MGRLLSEKPCEVTFNDRISGSRITLYYRTPTSEELIRYRNAQFTRRGQAVAPTMGEARLKYGAEILTGFAPGAFETDEGPLTTGTPGWKDLVLRHAPDVVEMLAVHVFELGVTLAEAEPSPNP